MKVNSEFVRGVGWENCSQMSFLRTHDYRDSKDFLRKSTFDETIDRLTKFICLHKRRQFF